MTDSTRRPGQMRVGHRERQATAEVLRLAASEGLLSEPELAERLHAAEASVTYADLGTLVADLPPLPQPAGGLQTYRPGMPGSNPDRRLVLSGGVSSHKQRGVWHVPPFLSLSAGLGSVKVDFQLAICPFEVVDVTVTGGMGSVVLVLPDGWAADVTGVRKGLGSVRTKVDSVPSPGRPLLLLHGQAAIGSVTVRRPHRLERRSAARLLRERAVGAVGAVAAAAERPASAAPPGSPQDATPQEWEHR
ncbi:MAG: DUF1707 domain-containing protein [Actinomycetota bacterium]|nr:DUF1707 domain-containing protein [Actinomycetota bacterium]